MPSLCKCCAIQHSVFPDRLLRGGRRKWPRRWLEQSSSSSSSDTHLHESAAYRMAWFLCQDTPCNFAEFLGRDGAVEWESLPDNRSWPDVPDGSKLCFRYGDPDLQVAKEPRVKFDDEEGKDSKVLPVPRGHRAKSHLDIRQRLVYNSSDKFKKNIEDRFDLDTDLLGEGGFGRVFKACDKETGASRAVKVVLKSRVTHMEEVKQELQLMQSMDHPNIVRLYGVYEDHCNLYLVMELCEGGELFDRLADGNFLTEPVARKIMKHVGCVMLRWPVASRNPDKRLVRLADAA